MDLNLQKLVDAVQNIASLENDDTQLHSTIKQMAAAISNLRQIHIR